MSEGLEAQFEASVDEGTRRLRRGWPAMMATGAVGGIDVGVGVLGLLVVEHETGSRLLGALAFTIGFLALTLANSELFTENFLVPINAVVTGDARLRGLFRLWGLTGAANLAGGYVLMALVMAGLPELGSTAVKVGEFYPGLGLGTEAFSLAILGGAVITLLTWMDVGTPSIPAKLAAAAAAAFLLAAAQLNHAVVISLEMFAALRAGAPFGYLDWLGMLAYAAVGNVIGGVGLVTLLRIVQVGRGKVAAERDRSDQGLSRQDSQEREDGQEPAPTAERDEEGEEGVTPPGSTT